MSPEVVWTLKFNPLTRGLLTNFHVQEKKTSICEWMFENEFRNVRKAIYSRFIAFASLPTHKFMSFKRFRFMESIWQNIPSRNQSKSTAIGSCSSLCKQNHWSKSSLRNFPSWTLQNCAGEIFSRWKRIKMSFSWQTWAPLKESLVNVPRWGENNLRGENLIFATEFCWRRENLNQFYRSSIHSTWRFSSHKKKY